jgi:hypothetical protein
VPALTCWGALGSGQEDLEQPVLLSSHGAALQPQRPANAPGSRSRKARGFRPARRSMSPVTMSKPPCTNFSWIDRIVPTIGEGSPAPSSLWAY